MLFVFNKFKLRKWSKYSSVKRLKILQALENKMAKKQHREQIDVVVHESSNWNCFGLFLVQNGIKRLFVHENLILNPAYRFIALETILHEGRHACQYEKINKEKLHWWEFEAKRWKKNFGAYVPSQEDMVLYNNQEVERDAQKYAIKWLKKLEHKYRNEKDFYRTLNNNIARFENADAQARKKYGLFYKHKMRKQIDQRYNDRY